MMNICNEIDINDWTEFSEGKQVMTGTRNIWVTNPEDDFGCKIFTINNDANENNRTPARLIREKKVMKIASDTDLDQMFTLLTSAHQMGYHPRPIETFNYKSIKGIKITKAKPASQELFDNRHKEIDYERLKSILNDSMVFYMSQLDANITNYGEINGSLVIVDFDLETLENSNIKDKYE